MDFGKAGMTEDLAKGREGMRNKEKIKDIIKAQIEHCDDVQSSIETNIEDLKSIKTMLRKVLQELPKS